MGRIKLEEGAYIGAGEVLCDLGQIDLIMALVVAQPVLITIGRGLSAGCQPLELLDRAIPRHFEVDADAAVEWAHREVDVDVGDPRLHDLGQHLIRLLVVCDPDLDCVLGWNSVLHAGR